MKLADIRTRILRSLERRPGEPLTEEELHESLTADGGQVSLAEVRKVCVSMVIEGRIDFLRGNSTRRYVLVANDETE